MSVEPQLAAPPDQIMAGAVQPDAGQFTQMLEELLSNAVGPVIAGGQESALNGADRTLWLGGMLNLINPVANGMGEAGMFEGGLTAQVGGSASLLEALAALRLMMTQDAGSQAGDDALALLEETNADDDLLSADGLLALAAAGWLSPNGLTPMETAADQAGRSGQTGPAAAGIVAESPTAAVVAGTTSPPIAQEGEPAFQLAAEGLQPTTEPVAAPQQSDTLQLATPETPGNVEAPVEASSPVAYQVMTSEAGPVVGAQPGVADSPAVASTPALQQIVQGVGMLVQRGETRVRLQLHPESLGQVLVQLTLSRGDVSVQLLADTAAARGVIQEHLTDLRTAFANQGLQVDALSVSVGGDPSAFNASAQQQHDWAAGNSPAPLTQAVHEEQVRAPAGSRTTTGVRSNLVDYHV